MIFLGCLGFAMFFLSDFNDARLHWKGLVFCFPLGGLLLLLACALSLAPADAPLGGLAGRLLCLLFGLAFLALLLHTLFGAFPAASAYAAPGEKRPVCRRGVYALCRHPGVLWLFGLMLCLRLGAGLPLLHLSVYTGLNLLLVLFEDRYVFPGLLAGYAAYRREVPFLLPTAHSVRQCFRSR